MEIKILYLHKDGTEGSLLDKNSHTYFFMRAPEAFFNTLRKALDICESIYGLPVFTQQLYTFKVKVQDSRNYMFPRPPESELLLNRSRLLLFVTTNSQKLEEGLMEGLKTLKDFQNRLSGIEGMGAALIRESLAIMVAGSEFLLGVAEYRDASIRLKDCVKEIQRYKSW